MISLDIPTYKTRLYRIYVNMKGRCYKNYNSRYKHYGKRGIKVCEEWLDSFNNFKVWAINNGYSDSLSIDRIDNNGNYEPKNCRWVDDITQANNTRVNRLITIDGTTKTIAEWSRAAGLTREIISYRLRSGWKGKELIIPRIKKGGDRNHPLSKLRLKKIREAAAGQALLWILEQEAKNGQ